MFEEFTEQSVVRMSVSRSKGWRSGREVSLWSRGQCFVERAVHGWARGVAWWVRGGRTLHFGERSALTAGLSRRLVTGGG